MEKIYPRDIVTITKPKNIKMHPTWNENNMDRYDGHDFKVKSVKESNGEIIIYLFDINYSPNLKWVKLKKSYQTKDINYLKYYIGDKIRFKNNRSARTGVNWTRGMDQLSKKELTITSLIISSINRPDEIYIEVEGRGEYFSSFWICKKKMVKKPFDIFRCKKCRIIFEVIDYPLRDLKIPALCPKCFKNDLVSFTKRIRKEVETWV